MNESQNHYAEWKKKLDQNKKDILYDSIYIKF